MLNRKLTVPVLILAFLVSTVAAALIVSFGKADPFLITQQPGEVSPPANVEPPTVLIMSPQNNSIFNSSNISLSFKVHIVVPPFPYLYYYYLGLSQVYYNSSWLSNNTYFDTTPFENDYTTKQYIIYANNYTNAEPVGWSGYESYPEFSTNITGVPDGSHSIEVFASEWGSREINQSGIFIFYGNYNINGFSVVNFTVDTTPPSVTVLSPQNKTYDVSDLSLNFKVNEPVSNVSYVLDGQSNATLGGNTTLTDLSYGAHNLTVYAWDTAGNIGASKVIFYIQKPFPTVTVAAISVASAVVVVAGLLVYFKKRKR